MTLVTFNSLESVTKMLTHRVILILHTIFLPPDKKNMHESNLKNVNTFLIPSLNILPMNHVFAKLCSSRTKYSFPEEKSSCLCVPYEIVDKIWQFGGIFFVEGGKAPNVVCQFNLSQRQKKGSPNKMWKD